MANLWSSADAYEAYMGRWSRVVAARFVAWLDVAPAASWLDVGCGTGALTQTVLDTAGPGRVVGADPSAAFIAGARAVIDDPRAEFRVEDAQNVASLGVFDTVVSGLVLNFLPDPDAALGAMVRAARLGGIVAAYVWDYAGQMDLMRRFWDAAVELDAAAAASDEGRRFTICNPDALQTLFSAQLDSVEVEGIVIPTPFESFHDYWRPFLGGVGSAPAYAMSLAEPQREELRRRLQENAGHGRLDFKARAWAVKGSRSKL